MNLLLKQIINVIGVLVIDKIARPLVQFVADKIQEKINHKKNLKNAENFKNNPSPDNFDKLP